MPKLTKTATERAKTPERGQAFAWCSEDHGFGIRINSSGSRTFIAQGRVNGKVRRVSIGRYGVFTVDQARLQAREILRGMRLGIDPVEEAARTRARGVTLREAIADYCTHRRTKNGPLRDRTKADIVHHGESSFPDWLDKPIKAITRDACLARFSLLSRTAPTRANQAFIVLRALLNFARDRYRANDAPLLNENPVSVLNRAWHPKNARTERIPSDRVGAVWRMLSTQALEGSAAKGVQTAAAIVQFLILTGARWQEAGALTWDCVDLLGKVPSWHIPAHRSKTASSRTLPLASQAAALLRRQPRSQGNPYVFIGRGGSGHIGHPGGTWDTVSAVAGLHLSAHSMRRTFTNMALKLGIEMWKVELLTSHVPTTTTLVHYTDTADLRETCASDIQRLGDRVESQAAIAARGRAWLLVA
jgi:integrase